LRAELNKQFPGATAEQISSFIPNKDEMTLMKIFTHSGDNVQVYCVNKNPAVFEVNHQYYPTGIYS
jgi:translation initiation factor 2D